MLGRHRYASEMPFKWRFDDDPWHFEHLSPLQLKQTFSVLARF